MSWQLFDSGSLIEEGRDAPYYAVYDGSGAWLRDYTADEVADADASAALESERAAREETRSLVKGIITDLQAEKVRCDAVISKNNNQINGGDTKDVARAGKRIADAAIELARFVQDM